MRKLNVPAALFIGLVVSFVGSFTVAAADIAALRGDGDFDVVLRWLAFEYGTTVAGALLVAVALFGVTDRLTGVPRVMGQIAAWSYAGVATWYVAQPLLEGIWQGEDVYQKTEYVYRAFGFAAFGALISLLVANLVSARGAERATARFAAVIVLGSLAVVGQLCGPWTPYLGPWISEHVWDGGAIVKLFWLVREGAIAVGMIAMVHGMLHGARAPSADPRRAVFGFRLAGRALLARVLAAIALALMGIGMVRSPGGVKMMLFIAPAVVSVSTLAFGIGLLLVERANLPGMPRVRLLLGVATVAWGVGLDLFNIRDLFHDGFATSVTWTIAAPLLSVAGVALIVSAVHGFATHKGDPQLRGMVASRATLFFTLMLVSALMPVMIGGLMHSPSSLVVLVVLAAACGIIAIVTLAGMMSLVADAVSDAPQLPEARLRS